VQGPAVLVGKRDPLAKTLLHGRSRQGHRTLMESVDMAPNSLPKVDVDWPGRDLRDDDWLELHDPLNNLTNVVDLTPSEVIVEEIFAQAAIGREHHVNALTFVCR